MKIHFLLVLIASFLSNFSFSQNQKISDVAYSHAYKTMDLFNELLSLPNDANNSKDILKNITWCEAHFAEKGFTSTRLNTPTVPLLLLERKVKNPQKTVLMYFQLDGQPVDSTKWFQPSPWKPVLKQRTENNEWEIIDWANLKNTLDPEWRIFARSTSDSKGPVAMFLAALDALKELGKEPSYDLKIIMDFEEELGSPNLAKAVAANSEALKADLLLIFDGPLHDVNKPTIKFGARGIATMTLKTFGPRVPQHSGHYGNYAPNPALRLSQLLASMKSEDGRVTIDGFYDGVILTEKLKEVFKSVPDDEELIKERLGIYKADAVGDNYREAMQYPSLNIRGLSSGWVGDKKRTIVPATATAEIDVRLVEGSKPEYLIQLIEKHISDKGYHIISTEEPTESERKTYDKIISVYSKVEYEAFQTKLDSEAGKWVTKAIENVHGEKPIVIRTSGGSIPISPFVKVLNFPAISVPTVNLDNNQHSPNENIRVGNYIDGVKTMIGILLEKF